MDIYLLCILISVLLSAYFAGAETAFLSYNKSILQAWLKEGKHGAKKLQFLTERPERFLTTALIGNNLSNVLYSSLIAVYLYRRGVSEELILVLSPLFLLVLGETLPKTLSRQLSNRIIIPSASLLGMMRIALLPIVKIVEYVARFLQHRYGISEQSVGRVLSRADITAALDAADEQGVLEASSGKLIQRMWKLNQWSVEDIMTPRTSVIAVPVDTPVKKARSIMIDSGFSRLPAYRNSIEEIIGVITATDLLSNPPDLNSIVRFMPVIPETFPLVKLPNWFRRHGTHLAGVVDEYGSFAGVVSREDLVEELVGPIIDEHDASSSECIRLSQRVWLVKGHIRLSHLSEIVGIDFKGIRARSLGGLITELAGSIPGISSEFTLDNVQLRVISSTPREVKLIRLTIDKPTEMGNKP